MHAAAQNGIGFPQFGVAQLLRREIGLHGDPRLAGEPRSWRVAAPVQQTNSAGRGEVL
jgi:hypothetical protein